MRYLPRHTQDGCGTDRAEPVSPGQDGPGAMHRLPRSERCEPAEVAPEPALRSRELPAVPRSSSISFPEADGEIPTSALRRQELRDVPRAGERWQGRTHAGRQQGALRDLPRRAGEE